ncbi:HAD family hydrolase [Actinoplanes regularis]|uniref:HAD family hydrolase n=1 Tax=Actinoplanes regularis TaxID=52697 RepID=UPI002552E480|nr:HAD family hydrolase [Actinoplanes regularis]
MLVDLDNTLIDRDSAFRSAVASFLAEHGLPGTDLGWIMGLDASGYTARDVVAAAMVDRYASTASGSTIHALLDNGAADRLVLARETEEALIAARARGWTRVIVTNGRTAQQEAKIRNTGLDRLVDGWVVSEAVGHRKPGPEIFHAAAGIGRISLRDAWVIGDSAEADIAGAVALGLNSVWVSNGRTWSQDAYQPTEITGDVATAIRRII